MRVFRRFSPHSSFAAIIALAVFSAAQTPQQDKSQKPQIKNFGCVNEKLYRGAQPDQQDYEALAALGVKTVIDLQREGDAQEQGMVETRGMKFYRIGMSDKSQPSADQAELFLKIVNDPANQPVFIHCKGGRHRTGAMTAIYRITHDGWSADQAYQEMKQYDFEYGMGHGALKRYVYSFYSELDPSRVMVSTHNK
jgi:protein tyrosine/serine phosphatase